MIDRIMAHFSIFGVYRYISLFSLAVLLQGISAQAVEFPQIPPEKIAADVEVRYDALTGQPEYVARDFDPFEGMPDLAGKAWLRSAQNATSIDGVAVGGGAFLDVSVMYDTDTPDAYDVRGFQEAYYADGVPAPIISYDNQTLDCSSKVTEVTYDNRYYNGAAYGYLAGIYINYPLYRGHRHYRPRHLYGYRDNYGWRHRPHRPRHGRFSRDRDDYKRYYHDRYDHSDRHDRRDRHDRYDRYDQDDRHSSDRRHERDRSDRDRHWRDRNDNDGDQGGRHHSDRNDRHPDRHANHRNVNPTHAPVLHPVRPPRNGQPLAVRPGADRDYFENKDRRNSNRSRHDRNRSESNDHRIDSKRSVRTRTGDSLRRVHQSRLRGDGATPRVSDSRPDPVTRPRSLVQPKPSSLKEYTKRSSSKRRSDQRPKMDRAVDRAFEGRNPKRGEHKLNYFPVSGYSQSNVYTSGRCLKEERLTVHIPQDRLDAARYDGFTIVLVDYAGVDIPVYVPPNYIQGFRQATGGASYSHRTSPPSGYPVPGR